MVHKNRVVACLSAATCHCLIQRRNRNADPQGLPLEYDVERTLASIAKLTSEVATAQRTVATREEDSIYTHYDTWLPEEDGPLDCWRATWIDPPSGAAARRQHDIRRSCRRR